MTEWEKIKRQFEAGTVCKLYKQTPRLHYEPGCMWIECDRGDDCRCRMTNGDTRAVTPLLAEWQARHALGIAPKSVKNAPQAYGIGWMSCDGLKECIPPAYTRHIAEAAFCMANDQAMAREALSCRVLFWSVMPPKKYFHFSACVSVMLHYCPSRSRVSAVKQLNSPNI